MNYYDEKSKFAPEGAWYTDVFQFHPDGTYESWPHHAVAVSQTELSDRSDADVMHYKVDADAVEVSFQRTVDQADVYHLQMSRSGAEMKGTNERGGPMTCRPGADPEKVDLGRRWTFHNNTGNRIDLEVFDLPASMLSGQGSSECEQTSHIEGSMNRSALVDQDMNSAEQQRVTVLCGPAFALCYRTYDYDPDRRAFANPTSWAAVKCQEENAIWTAHNNSRVQDVR